MGLQCHVLDRIWPGDDPQDFEDDDDDDDPDDVKVATLLDNRALRNVKVNWAGAGGQYFIITALAEDRLQVDDEH